MAEFNASRELHEAQERTAQVTQGERFIPVSTAIVAVLAALATLFSNHSSVTGLQARTQAGITQTKASDQYNYYESKRIKAEVSQALLEAGLINNSSARAGLRARIAKQSSDAAKVLQTAQAEEAQSEQELDAAERAMGSYEAHEIAATMFEVSIVLLSITALTHKFKGLLAIAGIGTAAGLAFFVAGLVR